MGHLTAQEAKLIRDAVLSRRTPKTLVDGKWSVSPLNQDPAVIGRFGGGRLPEKVIIRDITLRTIDQAPGVWITEPQRRHLAEELIRTGVSSLQIAWLAVQGGGDVKKEVEFIKKLNPDIELSVCGGTSQRVDIAADAGIELYLAYGPIVPEFQLIHGPYAREILRAEQKGEDWRKTINYPKTEGEFLKRLQDDVVYAKKRGMRAGLFTSMLHYATAQDMINFARAAREVDADEIGLGDGASGVSPEALHYIVSLIKQEAPDIPVSIHAHNAFGLGLAASLAAVQAGAEIIEVAVNHLCSGAGQTDFAEVAASLEVLYGVSTGIDLTRLTPLKELVEDMSGVRMSPNKAVTGDSFATYTEEAIFEEEEYAPVHKAANPEIFGNKAGYKLGRFSGVSGAHMIRTKLIERGVQVSDAQFERILPQLKAIMEMRRRTLSDEELAQAAFDIVSSEKKRA